MVSKIGNLFVSLLIAWDKTHCVWPPPPQRTRAHKIFKIRKKKMKNKSTYTKNASNPLPQKTSRNEILFTIIIIPLALLLLSNIIIIPTCKFVATLSNGFSKHTDIVLLQISFCREVGIFPWCLKDKIPITPLCRRRVPFQQPQQSRVLVGGSFDNLNFCAWLKDHFFPSTTNFKWNLVKFSALEELLLADSWEWCYCQLSVKPGEGENADWDKDHK